MLKGFTVTIAMGSMVTEEVLVVFHPLGFWHAVWGRGGFVEFPGALDDEIPDVVGRVMELRKAG